MSDGSWTDMTPSNEFLKWALDQPPLDHRMMSLVAGLRDLAAERDRYRAALEKIADPGCTGSDRRTIRCACDGCIAAEALKGARER